MRRTILVALSLPVLFLGSACAGTIHEPGPPARGPGPGASVEVSFFYGELARYGDWVLVEPYGWVWTPWGTAPGWRPYTVGQWVYTPYGWTWVSDWPWGWAPFHYGRWAWHAPWGWIWIPGRVWAPAWVAWRHGPGWLGWAPLPPGVEWRLGVGLWFGDVDLDLAIGANWWVFVAERDFLEPRPLRRAVPVARNPEILRQTRDVTRYEELGERVAVRSVPVEEIEGRTRRAVPRYEVEDLAAPPRRAEPADHGRVRIYRPEPSARPPAREPEPAAEERRKAVPRKPPPS